jgi:hypothetical protein
LQVIPCLALSSAADLTRPRSAHFDAE